ncbi:CshA/CshB family fibrillar adhesin-related protein, partial [Microbacterium album]|uniref:CshA/CshB family fibrillar adhesin-related protein n=1 Tax=Microbacterium album TaxID=2053191 RepID=UPI001E2F20C9
MTASGKRSALRSTSALAALTLVGGLLTGGAVMALAPAAPAAAEAGTGDSDAPSQAAAVTAQAEEFAPMRFAEGGTGLYKGSIDWFEWGAQGERIPAAGLTRTNTRAFAGGTLATTCSIGAPTGQGLVVQRPGSFSGDGLDDMYNVGGTGADNTLAIGLANFASGPAVDFDFSCSATLDGRSIPLAGLVMADAEASLATQGEYVAATIPAGAQWRIIDRYRPAGCTTDAAVVRDGQTLRFAGSQPHSCSAYPTGVAFMEGASSATATVASPNGRSAIALGVVLFTDFGDAPESYGDAGSIFSPPFTGAAAVTGGLFAQPLSTAGQPATRLGATVTSEQASQPSPRADADTDDAITEPGTVSVTPNGRHTLPDVACTGPGYVRGWIDWNGNGTFDATEASDPVLCEGTSVSLSWTVPTDVQSGPTFLRLRIGVTETDVASPTGITTAGEVEDWALDVQALGPFSCLPGAPGILFQQQPTDVHSIDLVTGASQQIATAISSANLNAAGYNPMDHYMYAFDQFDGEGIVRIGSDWSTEPLGLPSNWATVPVGVQTWLNTGEFDARGHYWVSNSNSAQPGWVEIDLSDPASPTYMEVVSSGNFTMPAGWLLGPDWGYSVKDGNLYSAAYMNTVSPVRIGLVGFDTDTKTASLVRDLGPLETPDGRPVSAQFGAVYTDPDGFLYASDNATGGIWRIDMASGDADFFAQGPAAGLNDGARCFNSPLPIDFGDAPDSYGTTLANNGPRHNIPGYDADNHTAPLMLGRTIDSETDGQPGPGADGDDTNGIADEDGVSDPIGLVPGQPTTVTVSATNDTAEPATLVGWIDLNGDGSFDNGAERVIVGVPAGSGTADYVLTFPATATVPPETYARFRLFPGDLDPADALPTGPAAAGEVEDYTAVFAPQVQCGPGGTLVPVDLITNPSFESRTGDFVNPGMSSINYATGWHDSHPWGGQYHVFSPTFDSGPGPELMPVRTAADGYGFMGGHSAEGAGEGATNTLVAALDPLSTYVGYYSVAAGGYGRQGNGYMQFYGVDDPNVGFLLDVPEVVPPTAANSELLYSTPVVEFPGVGATPQWERVSFTLNATRPWSHLRVEVRNETPANDATVEGQVWMNFDDFHLFECKFDVDFGDAPDSYGTTLANNGARHNIPGYDADNYTAPVMLGPSIDSETDGQPGAAADRDGSDDGVEFNPALGYPNPTIRTGLDGSSLQPVENTLRVNASAAGFVSVWVDWNQDGDFFDDGERVVHAQPVTAGDNDLTFSQGVNPAGISSYVRVRYSTDADSIAEPTGAAPDGEVEDYRVLFERLVLPDTCVTGTVDYYAFTFSDPVDRTGNGGVGSTARYENVSVISGVPVDMLVEVVAGSNSILTSGPNGFITNRPDDAAWSVSSDSTIQYRFVEAGTSEPVAVNAVFTVNDMDGYATSQSQQYEIATFTASDLASYAVTRGSLVTIQTTGSSVSFHGNGNNNGTPESRFQIVLEDKSVFEARWQGGVNSGFGIDGNGDLSISPPACEDFGDAPDSYGTTLANNGPRHTIVPGLTIGTKIDFDPDGQPSPLADGDDNNRIDDEDAFSSRVVLNPGATSVTLTVPVTNTTGQPATLYGWIDSNGSGRFEASEFASVTVPDGATSVELPFVGIPATVDGTTPVIRLRLTSDVLVDDPATPDVDERALGAASDGEVEDHLAQVATLVPISCVEPFVETFGTGTGYGDPLPAGQTTYHHVTGGTVWDGSYALPSQLPGTFGSFWHAGGDRTGDPDGRMMLVNADVTPGIFFQRTFTQLTPGASYDFSAWITNANNAGSPILPNVQFRVIDPATDNVLASVDTGDISNKSSLVWERFGLQFTAAQTTVRLEIANNAPGGEGNDLAIDDISFTPVCEFGDAPDSYGTTIAADGAAHIAVGPTLGVERDTEPDGQPSPGADGDDLNGTPNDEDGVAQPIVATQGRTTEVTVTATNDSDVDVTLAAWMDLDGNGTFDDAERVMVTVPAGTGTADYQVSFGEVQTGADTYARFRIYGGEVTDPSPT